MRTTQTKRGMKNTRKDLTKRAIDAAQHVVCDGGAEAVTMHVDADSSVRPPAMDPALLKRRVAEHLAQHRPAWFTGPIPEPHSA